MRNTWYVRRERSNGKEQYKNVKTFKQAVEVAKKWYSQRRSRIAIRYIVNINNVDVHVTVRDYNGPIEETIKPLVSNKVDVWHVLRRVGDGVEEVTTVSYNSAVEIVKQMYLADGVGYGIHIGYWINEINEYVHVKTYCMGVNSVEDIN